MPETLDLFAACTPALAIATVAVTLLTVALVILTAGSRTLVIPARLLAGIHSAAVEPGASRPKARRDDGGSLVGSDGGTLVGSDEGALGRDGGVESRWGARLRVITLSHAMLDPGFAYWFVDDEASDV
ncbi:hypothetical protein [Nocardia sp. NBC_01327]|uniref:hypothetical protein n=1 Tax=Nocardia sp. NBC_01327 TaxID=2903593 RepID=UPI002E136D18|nr:hypothetical protein OG326_03520 [Nocardia sp. NBC_01327]